MTYWLLPDPHFGHDKMMEYCGRPAQFEMQIFENVRKLVRPDDVLICLGDFCIYKDEEWHKGFMEICPAKRWLIRGNHDKKSLGWYLSHGWDFVADEVMMEAFGMRIVFSHRPVDRRDGFDLNIHGHHHNTRHHPEDVVSARNRLVFIEHEYTPINLRKVVEG